MQTAVCMGSSVTLADPTARGGMPRRRRTLKARLAECQLASRDSICFLQKNLRASARQFVNTPRSGSIHELASGGTEVFLQKTNAVTGSQLTPGEAGF